METARGCAELTIAQVGKKKIPCSALLLWVIDAVEELFGVQSSADYGVTQNFA